MTSAAPVIVWFRDDLRLADNPALLHAAKTGSPLLCLYVHDEHSYGLRRLGGAARWWLAGSLRSLGASLEGLGSRLVIAAGPAEQVLPEIARRTGAGAVVWNRRYGNNEQRIDSAIKTALTAAGVPVSSFNGRLLHEPWTVTGKSGGPMKVFTPFWRTCLAKGAPAAPLPSPASLQAWSGADTFPTVPVDTLGLEPTKPDWATGLRAHWNRGEAGAGVRLAAFLAEGLAGYGEGRNRPDLPSTSQLSPHLRFGEVSVRQCWHAAVHAHARAEGGIPDADLETFLKELGWREFSYHLLHHNPNLAASNYNPRFDAFPWRTDADGLADWQRGRTGYPIVDAGMRELYSIGWMHNRVRMIVASFLVKHLMIDWRAGEDWFWDTLVDADPASNAASWQWVAGSGADAAPYFRIFNPILQGEKFDPDGAYVKRWVPELAALPARWVHQPWTAPSGLLRAHGVTLGGSYPHPVVAHDAARQRALAAFSSLGSAPGAPD